MKFTLKHWFTLSAFCLLGTFSSALMAQCTRLPIMAWDQPCLFLTAIAPQAGCFTGAGCQSLTVSNGDSVSFRAFGLFGTTQIMTIGPFFFLIPWVYPMPDEVIAMQFDGQQVPSKVFNSSGYPTADGPTTVTGSYETVVGPLSAGTYHTAQALGVGGSYPGIASATIWIGVLDTPYSPPPDGVVSLIPGRYGYGSVKDRSVVTATFTVTNNSGSSGAINVALKPVNGGFWTLGARTCPADGATMNPSTSCTITVSFEGDLQCGGSPIQRPATLNVAVGDAVVTSSLYAANYVYSPNATVCR